jgi:aspartate racemase
MQQSKVIGIVGGLGPFAHIDLERKLLRASQDLTGATRDQDYPEWIVSSIPSTPDRTTAFLNNANDPVPFLVRSLQRLMDAGADFAIVPCNTAHLYLEDARALANIPVVDMIDLVARHIEQVNGNSTVGILATTGTVQSSLYHNALKKHALTPVTPLDLHDGDAIQRDNVMAAIYGPYEDGRHVDGGIKSGELNQAKELLKHASERMIEDLGAKSIVAGCTEIPLALSSTEVQGVPLVDPADLLAREAIRLAYSLSK